jgi:4-hydroxythreonine-4-phosphate dehydrogenase
MIYISQGHEKGIGLEIFFKALLQLPQYIISSIELHAETRHIQNTARTLNFDIEISEDSLCYHGISIAFKDIKASDQPASSESLLSILKSIKPEDVLITLPTSKDQLILNGTSCSGYTEFFRAFYKDSDISMLFHSEELDILLLTDHIPLRTITNKITESLVINKITNSIHGLREYFDGPDEIISAGINPHAGEGGILGNEDTIINQSIIKLRESFPKIKFSEALPGDTLHFHKRNNEKQLFVYSYHDQGLPFFKEKYGLFGINVTMGLPFIRLSVDHGTAFNLYGKNKANCGGLLHVIYSAYKVSNR